MTQNYINIYKTLHAIYDKFWSNYRENQDSKQMCCMWSTDDPPDVVEGTKPLLEMEETFGVVIDEDAASELYDLRLDEATKKIMELMKRGLATRN